MDVLEETGTLSFTIDDDGTVLELTAMDTEGELYYREGNQWVHLSSNEDHPTIFEVEMVDVTSEDRKAALEMWDSAQESDLDLTRDNILSFTNLG